MTATGTTTRPTSSSTPGTTGGGRIAPRAAVASARPRGGLVSAAYLRVEVRRLLRNRRALVFSIGLPVAFFFTFGANQPDATTKAYVMVSLAVYGAMVAATSTGAAVAVERASGWSRQLRLTPLTPSAYVASKVLAALVFSAVPVLVEFAVGAASGARMDGGDWLVAGLVAWGGSVLFAAFGLAVGFLVPSEAAMQVVGGVMALLAMLGGLFVPLSVLGATMRRVAEYTPAYGVGTLARHPLASEGSVAGALANVVVWTALFSVAAALLFRRDTARV